MLDKGVDLRLLLSGIFSILGLHKTLGVNVFAPGVFSFPMKNSLKNKLL